MLHMIGYGKKVIREIHFRLLHGLRSAQPNNRMVPQFLIIGAQKGGTSSLFYYLKTHPQIKRSIKKEIHFFNIFYDRGLRWYLSHFPSKSDKYITGEASPDYIFHPESPKRVYRLNPNMKLIVLLREPIERAYSAYQMNRRLGIDPRETFMEAVSFELNHKDKKSTVYNYDRHNFFYLERGKYAQQLSTWLTYFAKENLLIVTSQRLFNNTKNVISDVHKFLEIDSIQPASLKAMNVGEYQPLPEELHSSLSDHFKKDLKMLKDQWNIDFSN